MQTRFILGGLIIVAIAVISIAFFTLPNNTAVVSNAPNAQSGTNNTPVSNSTTATAQPSGYTLADVSGHNNAQSCWAAINGKVYDLTSWIHQHPGGPERILSLCGTDGSAAFNAQHGGQSQPASALAHFYIGMLAAQ